MIVLIDKFLLFRAKLFVSDVVFLRKASHFLFKISVFQLVIQYFSFIKQLSLYRVSIRDGINERAYLFNFKYFLYILMIAEGAIVKGWAISTASKIEQLLDQFVINYPQGRVRKTTTKLLASLFKKGTEEQKGSIMKLLIDRLQQLNSMGKSSEEFLSLITKIFQLFPEGFAQEKILIFNSVLGKSKEIFSKITENKEYGFYSLCSNMIEFGEEFKPYLLEANGCLKCFGRPDVDFEQANFSNIKQELRVHLNTVEWVLKRRYEINNLTMNFIKKKLNFKSLIIYYYDQQGSKKELGKITPNDNIPTFNVITNTFGITFEFNKIRRNHISCIVCSANEEYAVLCSNCVGKIIDIEGSVKVVAGNPAKINKELTESFKALNVLRSQLEGFAYSVSNQAKITPIKAKIVSEMETCYTNIIQNLRLLRTLNENELKTEREKYESYTTDCYSCHFFEFASCTKFTADILKNSSFKIQSDQLLTLINDFKEIFFRNKVQSLNSLLSSILSELFNRITNIDYFIELSITSSNKHLIVKLIANLIEHIKVQHKENEKLLEELKKWLLDSKINSFFNMRNKIQLFVMLELSEEYYFFLNEQPLEFEKLQDIKRLSIEQYEVYKQLLNFNISEILQQNISNIFKLFLVLLPDEHIPASSLDIVDAEYLKYTRNEPPTITEELILSNIVFTPIPIIKLNLFKLLPQIIEQLPLEQSIELIKQLCKYKPLWNTNIIETVDNFNKKLDGVEKERKLMLCLQGYEASKQNLYFDHIYKILTPQRTNFIIRLEIPEKEMQKEEKNKGGPVEYIYLPTREIKSEDLKSDTIGGLHEWITEQIRRLGQDMPFDLIVENNIIDNLDLSLEIIYKKIVQKENKRQIGSQVYDFFKVIYRIQGIFGEANERNCGNPRDEKLEECINFSSHLLNKLSTKKTGLDVLMETIPSLEQNEGCKDKKQKMIKILGIIFKNETIIEKIVEWQYGNTILDMTVKSISLNKQNIRSTETLLEMCSKIIDEANLEMIKIRKESGVFGGRKPSQAEMDIEADNEESEKSVKYILEKVKQAEENGFKHISKKLIKMLPFCSRDDFSASKYLFQFFEVTKILQVKYSQKLSWFLEYINALSESYSSFKMICREQGITDKMVELIEMGLSVLEKESLDNLQICFTLCKGLIQGDMHLQELLFEKGILHKIYQVAGIGLGGLPQQKRTKLGKIPLICFQITKYFQEGKMINSQVHDYFAKNEEEKKKSIQKQKLERKKEILLKQNKIIKEYKHLMVEQGNESLSCSSCKEGYSNKKEVLGVYLYSTKTEILSLEGWWKDNKKVQAITSTSYFEPIHLECHIKAMKDDLKIQKSQWDGAIIRNSEVLCNNWCPFRGPQTTDEEFDKTLIKYFERNNKNISFWVILNDLNGLLEKFSKEYNFAHETKGSSPSHNAKLIPVLMSIVCHLLRNSEDIKYLREGMAHIESHLTKKPNLVHLYFCLLLFSITSSGFNSKKDFCLRLIDHLSYGHFKDSKPFYIELALVQKILKITHKGVEGPNLTTQLSESIKKNLENILQNFEDLSEQYKNVFCRWQNLEQAKQYFQK